MKHKKCHYYKHCRNGDEGCWITSDTPAESCVRFLPIEGGNLTEINGIIETPPNIDYDKFSQYFSNWIDSMGWNFCGTFHKYEDEEREK